MSSIIDRIQSKPPHERDRIIKIIAGALIALMLIVWLIVGNGKKPGEGSSFIRSFTQKVKGTPNTFNTPQK